MLVVGIRRYFVWFIRMLWSGVTRTNLWEQSLHVPLAATILQLYEGIIMTTVIL